MNLNYIIEEQSFEQLSLGNSKISGALETWKRGVTSSPAMKKGQQHLKCLGPHQVMVGER